MKKVLFNLNSVAELLVKHGMKSGADDIEVSIDDGKNFSVEIRDGKIEKLIEAGSRSMSLKVIVDQKVATASSSDFDIDTLKKLTEDTIRRAGFMSPDTFASIPVYRKTKVNEGKLDLFDMNILKMPPEKKIDFAKAIEGIALKDKRIRLSLGSYFASGSNEYFLANSNGFSGSYRITSCSTGVELQAGTGDNIYEDGWNEASLKLGSLPPPEDIAVKAVNRTVRLIGARKVETQKVPVVFEPMMTGRILGMLSGCVSGTAVYMNRSFLKDKIGERISHKEVNITDDALMPGGLGSRPFDSEGVPSQKTRIVENGILKNYLLDTYSAKKLKMHSTGNDPGPSNFYLKGGEHSQEDIIKSVKKGMLLVKTIGQGFNSTTGDLSTGAYGIWIENGELSFPVSEVTISGNLSSMLKDIEMIGNDLDFGRQINGPTIKVSEMTIAGK